MQRTITLTLTQPEGLTDSELTLAIRFALAEYCEMRRSHRYVHTRYAGMPIEWRLRKQRTVQQCMDALASVEITLEPATTSPA